MTVLLNASVLVCQLFTAESGALYGKAEFVDGRAVVTLSSNFTTVKAEAFEASELEISYFRFTIKDEGPASFVPEKTFTTVEPEHSLYRFETASGSQAISCSIRH